MTASPPRHRRPDPTQPGRWISLVQVEAQALELNPLALDGDRIEPLDLLGLTIRKAKRPSNKTKADQNDMINLVSHTDAACVGRWERQHVVDHHSRSCEEAIRQKGLVRMPLDDATAQFVAQMAEAGGPAIHEMSPVDARAMSAGIAEILGPGPEMSAVRDHQVTSADGQQFPVRVFDPDGNPRGCIVYLHAGGWVVGSLAESDSLARRIAQRTGCLVALVDYRLAPEWPFPTAVEDAEAALQWVTDRIEELAGSPVPLVVAGESSGGNLAAVVARRAHDAAGPQLALQVLVCPVTDCDLETESYLDPENQTVLTREAMAYFWEQYVPEPADRRLPDASPLRADDLSDLPPALVLTAESDPLRDEGEAYADALRAAGVGVEHHRLEGQAHGFFSLLMLPGHDRGLAIVAAAIDHAVR